MGLTFNWGGITAGPNPVPSRFTSARGSLTLSPFYYRYLCGKIIMTVLVTGGAGYIGSHMVLDLLDAGEDILVLDNLSTGFAWALPAGTRLIRGDFGDAALLEEIFSTHPIEAVLHFAARSIVPESVAQPLDYYDTNVAGGRGAIY